MTKNFSGNKEGDSRIVQVGFVGPPVVGNEGAGLIKTGPRARDTGNGRVSDLQAEKQSMQRGAARAPVSFRLPRFAKPTGGGTDGHRSGWPYVTACMREQQRADGMLLDDFVEATFAPGRKISKWRRALGLHLWMRPWVGVFHLPPNLPEWFSPKTLEAVFREPRFLKSLPQLKGAVVFSEHTASALRDRLDVPIQVAKHPTELVPRTFSWDMFTANPDKLVVQIGWYLRNYRAIYQISVPPPFRKVHLAQSKPFIDEARRRTDLYSPYRDRPDLGETEVLSWIENDAYDNLLTQNIIFLELFEASANNAITEAIARNTPVVVNRHPAVMEYLGKDYPLFYNNIHEVSGLLEMPRIRAAHEHIRALDKTEFAVEVFISRLDQFVRGLQ